MDLDQIEMAEKLPDGSIKIRVAIADVDAVAPRDRPSWRAILSQRGRDRRLRRLARLRYFLVDGVAATLKALEAKKAAFWAGES